MPGKRAPTGASICTFVLVKQVNCTWQALSNAPATSSSATLPSILQLSVFAPFVQVKQVNPVPAPECLQRTSLSRLSIRTTFVLVKPVNRACQASWGGHHTIFVLVKQVNRAPAEHLGAATIQPQGRAL
jgi:hypothetical protein